MARPRDGTRLGGRLSVRQDLWFHAAAGFAAPRPTGFFLEHPNHELMGMIASRAVLAIESSQIARMGAEAARVDALAAREIWTALGVPYRMGATEENTAHCSRHEGFTPALEALAGVFAIGVVVRDGFGSARLGQISPSRTMLRGIDDEAGGQVCRPLLLAPCRRPRARLA